MALSHWLSEFAAGGTGAAAGRSDCGGGLRLPSEGLSVADGADAGMFASDGLTSIELTTLMVLSPRYLSAFCCASCIPYGVATNPYRCSSRLPSLLSMTCAPTSGR